MSAEMEKIALLEQINNAFQMAGTALSAAVTPHVAQQVASAGVLLFGQAQALRADLKKRLANDDGPRARDLRWMSKAISRAYDVSQLRWQEKLPEITLKAGDSLSVIAALAPRRFKAKDPRSLGLITARYFEAGMYNIPLGDPEPHFNGCMEVMHAKNSRHFLYTGGERTHYVFDTLPLKDDGLIYDPVHGGTFTFRDVQDNGSIVRTTLRAGGRTDVFVEHNALEELDHPGQYTHFNSSGFFKRLSEQLAERDLQNVAMDAPDTVITFREALSTLMQTAPVPRHFHYRACQWLESPHDIEINRSGARVVVRYTAEEGVEANQDVSENAALMWCLKFDTKSSGFSETLLLKGSGLIPLHLEDRSGKIFKLAVSQNEFLDDPLSDQGDNILHITGNGWKYITQTLQRLWPVMLVQVPPKKVTVEDTTINKDA